MPVLDHAVHPSTVGGDRYGCNGPSKREKYYWARTVDYNVVPPLDKWVQVEDKSTISCQFDMSLVDSKCAGCPQYGVGQAYNVMVRSKGK